MSQLRVNNVTNASGTGSTYAPGHVVQVVSVNKTDTFSTSSTSMVDITGLTVSITPRFANSKILAIISANAGTNVTNFGYLQLVRDATPVFVGDSSAGRPSVSTMYYTEGNSGVIYSNNISYLDSPNTTSAVTYKMQCRAATSGTVYLNRSDRDSASTNYDARTASSITLMEIAQ
jgi:hypothetical protein